MKNERVQFKRSVSSMIGSFGINQIEVLPENITAPWLNQGICVLHPDQSGIKQPQEAKPAEPVELDDEDEDHDDDEDHEDEKPSAANKAKAKTKKKK